MQLKEKLINQVESLFRASTYTRYGFYNKVRDIFSKEYSELSEDELRLLVFALESEQYINRSEMTALLGKNAFEDEQKDYYAGF